MPGVLSTEGLEALRWASTASLTSQLLKRGYRNTFIAGLEVLRPQLRMVGYAFTLRYVPTREDLGFQVAYDNATNVQRLAVEQVRSGEVLVIDAREQVGAASFGHILATRLLVRGAAGIVTDGALRDTAGFRALNLPTYARAAHATTSSVLHHPADMQVPVGCGGVLVMPGDVIVGDAEGVVVIPSAIADEVARDARAQDLLEDFLLEKIESGRSITHTYPPDAATQAEYRASQSQDPKKQ